jgi:HTH-type transcriptional regulator/antitoxin HipB
MRPIRTTRDLGAAVRRRRRELGLNQADLAAHAGVSRPWISSLEGGKRTAEVGLVLSVLSALELDVRFEARTPTVPPGPTGPGTQET